MKSNKTVFFRAKKTPKQITYKNFSKTVDFI